jgi:hypothetical protein
MKTIQLFSTAIICGLVLTLTSCESDSISPAETDVLMSEYEIVSNTGNLSRKAGTSVNGQGTINLENGNSRRFSFHANTDKDGSVSGNGVLTYTKGVRKIMFDINCMSVEEGMATISGNITEDKQVASNVGNIVWFQVVDNGEGKNSTADQMTLMIVNSGIECDSDLSYNLLFYDIEGGNIQLKN